MTSSTTGKGLGIAEALAAVGANVVLIGFGDAVEIETVWSGPVRLHLVPHVNASVADLTLPYGRVPHDYRQAAAGALT